MCWYNIGVIITELILKNLSVEAVNLKCSWMDRKSILYSSHIVLVNLHFAEESRPVGLKDIKVTAAESSISCTTPVLAGQADV